jgi:hypothetical protein
LADDPLAMTWFNRLDACPLTFTTMLTALPTLAAAMGVADGGGGRGGGGP